MTAGIALFDLALVPLLLWLAWLLLSVSDLFRAAVLFIAFGLLMSLAWVRLRAPDVALAEAAIGAGITGALVLTALGRLGERGGETDEGTEPAAPAVRLLLPLGALALLAVLGGALQSLPPKVTGAGAQVASRLGESGVENPVTAVLLNFRGYDTLLEIGVLFLAALGGWGLGEAEEPPLAAPGAVLISLVRLLLPLLVLVSGYLLWLGGHAPGGAFQGGAVLASAGVLLLLAGLRPSPALTGLPLRAALAGGFAFFLATAAGVTAGGAPLLQYPPGWSKGMILLVEAVLTPAIAATLVLLFAGGRPPVKKGGEP